MARELTEKQKRFVEQYLIDLNATQAYIRAGYEARGNAAEVNAARLLRNAQVAAAVQAARSAQQQRTQIDADYVIRGLKAEAEDRGDGSSHSARVAALGLLGKHLGMFVDRHEIAEPVRLHIVKKVVTSAPGRDAGDQPPPRAG